MQDEGHAGEGYPAGWIEAKHGKPSCLKRPAERYNSPGDVQLAEGLGMMKKLRGVVHGRTVEFTEDLGVPDGQEVEVRLEPVKIRDGRGILSVAGALADDPEWDQIMEEIYLERKGIYRQASQEK
jgi:hypothetical protein